MWLLLLLVGLAVTWLSVMVLLPWLLARMLSFYMGTSVRIGSFRRGFEVSQLQIQTKTMDITVDSLRLTSSIFSSEANNLITLIFTGMTVVLRPSDQIIVKEERSSAIRKIDKGVSKKLMLIAQFFGLQLRETSVVLTRVPGLSECCLVLHLGELRLDSAVIHHTRLSLASILYHGKISVRESIGNAVFLEANFAFRANLQALLSAGRLSCIEEVGLDVDRLGVQLSCALFQRIDSTKGKVQQAPASQDTAKISNYAIYIPRQAQIKAENCSMSVEHTDRSSQLEADLQLLYLSSKSTEAARSAHLPDSHISGQLSGFRVRSVDCDLNILELSRFQTLVQKEADTLHSDTQIHELRGRYNPALCSWLSSINWLVQKLDKSERERGWSGGQADPNSDAAVSTSWLQLINHQHQIDAWNTDLVLEDEFEWQLSLHHLQASALGKSFQVSLVQANCSTRSVSVLHLGQVDLRLCSPNVRKQVDVMMTDSVFSYHPALVPLATRLKEIFRRQQPPSPPLSTSPSAPSTAASRPLPPSLAFLISQTKIVWARDRMELVFEMRELEAAGDTSAGELTVSGLKFSQCSVGIEAQHSWLSVARLMVGRKEEGELRLGLDQRVRLAWQPALHCKLLACATDAAGLMAALMPPAAAAAVSASQKRERAGAALVTHINVTEKMSLLMTTGKHSVKLLVSQLNGKLSPVTISWMQIPQLRVKFDQKEVLRLEDLVLSSVPRSDKVSAERRRMEGCQQADNSCLLLAASSAALTAPYQFDLHSVFTSEFLGIVKWLKLMHKKCPEKVPSVPSLPKDVLVNIKHFKFELTDDPFEVRLRDNYELKKDEYQESQKRLRVLEERIEELRRKNLMFPTEKVEELLKNLKRKNAEIYMQRAKKLYAGSQPRTRLLEWELRGLEMMILADPSMQGRDTAVRHLIDVDSDSPWPPDHQLEFTTLWCRWIRVQADSWTVSLRDFPQNLLDIRTVALWGKLAGAESAPSKRAIRNHRVEIGEPFGDVMVERNMVPLKFYYDLACDVETLSMAYGLCWEPALTQCSIALNYLTGNSYDPSTPLPFWDKIRLLFHGRLLLAARSHQLLLHASLDPYNTTEEMDVSWTDMELVWSEATIRVHGTLDIYVRTASKYDDGHLLHLPNLSFLIKMEWICLANPKDHHSVMPCAPDKLPEYSSNQEHDSYRAFRSSSLNLNIQFETKSGRGNRGDRPKLDMFSSTLRWFENLKFIFSGATRPIRRGAIFQTARVRKPPFSRHVRKVVFSVSLHQFQVNYWTSFSQQRGILLNVAQGIRLSAEHQLNLVPYTDGLKRRPRADWSISFINSVLATSDIWIQSAVAAAQSPPVGSEAAAATMNDSPVHTPSPQGENNLMLHSIPSTSSIVSGRDTLGSRGESAAAGNSGLRNMEKSFFFCVEEVLYTREDSYQELGRPTHRLVIHGARGAWTQSNRDMFFALYDSWRRAQILRKNVASDALKLFHSAEKASGPATGPPEMVGAAAAASSSVSNSGTPFTSPTPASQPTTSSPFSWGNTKGTGSLLDRLLQETEGGTTPTAYSEDMSAEAEVKHSLEAMAACTLDDIVHWNWSIELVNSQVLLRGIETQGYVIMSAARAGVSQNLHRPVWKERALLSKTTWSGVLESMQYYATVSEQGADLENIMWLTLDNIGEGGEECRVPGPAGLVGSGKAVGGVVSKVVGGVTSDPGVASSLGIQLQRIVSRCKAEFFYVSYGDTALEDVEASLGVASTGAAGSVGGGSASGGVFKFSGASPVEDDWNETQTAVNAFSLVHHDLNVCTNSLQYAMVLDIINNLLLYSEPAIKARTDKYLRMRYQFMLEIDTIDEQRKKIIKLQNQLRQFVCTQRQKEKEIYLLSSSNLSEDKKAALETETAEIKDKLMAMSEDLDMMIRCYKETQMSSSQRQSAIRGEDEGAKLRRRGEICFSKAAWRLTEIDGQLGIADINISNFLFTRSSMSDDSVENLVEMGYVHVKNLLPNQLYENVLTPTELRRDMPVDRQRTVRVYSRERARVGGISVKDHFEINVAPLTIGITAQFYKKMMAFAFPEKDTDTLEEDYEVDRKQKKKLKKPKNANFYVECPNMEKDDVEKMKERAERNKLFIYIKIPEVPIKVSYKGEKEKNQILDVADFQLQVPTIEYHNETWTWLDLLLSIKSKTRESLVTQAIKQKFLRNKQAGREEQAPGEEEKARMLLGSSSMPGTGKTARKIFPSFRK